MSIETLISQVDPFMAAKIAAGIVGAGFACAGVGHMVEKAGVGIKSSAGNDSTTTSLALRKLGGGMEACGRGLFLAGKYTAYTVLVPAYIATYEFPKWTVCKALPKVGSLVNKLVITPVLKGVECVASQVAKMAEALFVHLIWPVMKTLLWKPLTFLAPKIEKLAILVCEGVLIPIADAIERIAVRTIKGAVEIIKVLDRFVFSPVLQMTTKIGNIAFKILVKPAYNLLRFVTKECVLPVVSKVIKVVNTCIVTPIADAIVWTYQDLILPVASAARAVMDFAHRYFIELPLRCISQYVFKPVIHLISTSVKLIHQKLLVPIYEVTAQSLNILVTSILMPVFLVSSICKQIWEDVCLFFRVETTSLSKRKIEPNPGFVRRVILHPIKNAFANIAGIFFLIYALYVIRKRRNSA